MKTDVIHALPKLANADFIELPPLACLDRTPVHCSSLAESPQMSLARCPYYEPLAGDMMGQFEMEMGGSRGNAGPGKITSQGFKPVTLASIACIVLSGFAAKPRGAGAYDAVRRPRDWQVLCAKGTRPCCLSARWCGDMAAATLIWLRVLTDLSPSPLLIFSIVCPIRPKKEAKPARRRGAKAKAP